MDMFVLGTSACEKCGDWNATAHGIPTVLLPAGFEDHYLSLPGAQKEAYLESSGMDALVEEIAIWCKC